MRYKDKKYHYFYKITNLLNNHFYYGVHNTNKLEDGYMGSGKRLKYAYEKYGIENFKKEILSFFDTGEKAFEYEAEIVNEELIKDPNCYNIQCGGKGINSLGLVTVIDKDNNTYNVRNDDPNFLSGEVIALTKNKLQVKIKNDSHKNRIRIEKDDPRYLSGELESWSTGYVTVYDRSGNFFLVKKDDPRYLSGELKFLWTGKHRKKESIEKAKQTFKKIKHQQGEKNSQFGKCWIHNVDKSISIKKDELDSYLKNGWIKGRKLKFD